MDELGQTKTPWHLWVIGIIALLWNAGGVASYLTTELRMLESMGAPPEQIEFFYSFPAWSVAFWALGVWGCLFGSFALLFRSRFAPVLYGISIIGLLGTTYYQRAVADIPPSLQSIGNDMFAVAIWLITLFLFFYASRMKRAGVLR